MAKGNESGLTLRNESTAEELNRYRSATLLFLIGLFSNISVYLIMIGLEFIGLAYLVVYVGAISILFLFILMLINIRISELQSNTRNILPLAITIGIGLNYLLFDLLPYDVVFLSNYYYVKNLILLNEYFFLNNLYVTNNSLYYVTSDM